MTQAQINARALDACAPELRDDCLTSMGYVRPEETALRGAAETPIEGLIGAGICVLLGVIWLAAKARVALFGGRVAYKHITR